MNKFLWGASTSGFQVEGGYNLGGKGLSTTDVRHVKEGIADTKVASDHYHHFKEDILLMKELGLKHIVSLFVGQELCQMDIMSIKRVLNFMIKLFNYV